MQSFQNVQKNIGNKFNKLVQVINSKLLIKNRSAYLSIDISFINTIKFYTSYKSITNYKLDFIEIIIIKFELPDNATT